jgi:hypothetical protein
MMSATRRMVVALVLCSLLATVNAGWLRNLLTEVFPDGPPRSKGVLAPEKNLG